MAASLKQMVISFVAPIKDIGIAATDVSIEDFSKDITEISKTDYSYAFVADKDGNIIMHPDKNLINTKPEITKQLIEKYKNNKFLKNNIKLFYN